jgi:hypothetical protein
MAPRRLPSLSWVQGSKPGHGTADPLPRCLAGERFQSQEIVVICDNEAQLQAKDSRFLEISRILPTSEEPTTAKESIKLLRTCKGNFKTNFSQPRAGQAKLL